MFPLLSLVLCSAPLEVPLPYRDEYTPPAVWTADKAALGKRLFHEKELSEDRTLSCASCHDPERSFTDNRPVAEGVRAQRGERNTPSIVNRALGKHQFWDGRAKTLELQALGPIANPLEMNLSVAEAVTRLKKVPGYTTEFQKAFGGGITPARIAEALAHYERTVYSVESPFDRFLDGDGKALSVSARKGLELFGGKAKCGECHAGINFTDENFHTVGVGGVKQLGRAAVTKQNKDRGGFKTPGLREVARTAPYMHDGSLATLADVIEWYDRGGDPHPNKDKRIHPLNLTVEEKKALVAFLESLTGRVVEVSLPVASASEQVR
jgi:cytochrome c peroxidase